MTQLYPADPILKGSRNMLKNRRFASICRALPVALATLCAVFMLCVVPLVYHDAFFDINRVKVNAVIRVAPVFAAFSILAAAFVSAGKAPLPSARKVYLSACLFAAACVVSCALCGFEEAVITGSEGRYCGLQFMLCCIAAFFVISSERVCLPVLLPALILTSAICAALGVANAMGLDPLGFYDRIKKGQEQMFLSTIGHFDFFGTFLVMMFPFAGAQFVFVKNRLVQLASILCASVIALGAVAARTDSAFAGLHMACFLLLALSGGSLARMGKACILWGIAFAALPVMYTALQHSPFHPDISGLPKMLYQMHAGEAAAAVLILAGIALLFLYRKKKRTPGQKSFLKLMIALFSAFILLCLCAVVYFSVFDTRTPLGAASSFLRFNDHWGSLRGFVYVRALRAYADFDLVHKLFGGGLDLALRLLTPYFDDPSMLRFGVFNDVHCQPLQMLLTCGLFGMASFLALYGTMLHLLFVHAKENSALCGVLASLFSYGLVMLINVTQPILILTYFSICALGISCLRSEANLGRQADES